MYEPANVAELINKLLKEKNLQQKDMLMECGLNKNTISSMLSRGSMVKADTLAKIADFLSCSVDYLLGRTENPEIYHYEKASQNANKTAGNIPVVSSVKNFPIFHEEAAVPDFHAVHNRSVAYSLYADDNSMEPVIRMHELIDIIPFTELVSEEIGIFLVQDETVCRKIRLFVDKIELCPFNPDYPTLHISRFSPDHFQVLGKVALNAAQYARMKSISASVRK